MTAPLCTAYTLTVVLLHGTAWTLAQVFMYVNWAETALRSALPAGVLQSV